MTSRDIIQKILAENPQLSEEQVLERLTSERARTGGLLSDETLLRLIAAKLGVTVEQYGICNSGTLSTSRLCAGLNDVTVAGRLIAVFAARSFEGEKPGKYATLMIADNYGILRVVLWNDKAELVESGELKVGQAVRLSHGYTKEDRYGKVELHLGGKSMVEVEPQDKANSYPTAERFTTKIGSLTAEMGAAHVRGVVKEVFEAKPFTRADSTDGLVMRFTLADDSGSVTAVAWNDKAMELQKSLKPGVRLLLVNARVKDTPNGMLEVHVDQSTYINLENAA
jgi:replication factor A1